MWKKALDSIGIRLAIDKGKLSDQLKAAIGCQHQMSQLLYGSNINQSNIACYSSPNYDALYLEAQTMRDSPSERGSSSAWPGNSKPIRRGVWVSRLIETCSRSRG